MKPMIYSIFFVAYAFAPAIAFAGKIIGNG
jgi:hypothetical protein